MSGSALLGIITALSTPSRSEGAIMLKMPTIEISIINGFSGVLLNRDMNGLAKRLDFGNTTRVRVSSQCIKRHWRVTGSPHALKAVGDTSIRSKDTFGREIALPLIGEGLPEEAVIGVLLSFQDALFDSDKEEKKKSKADRRRAIRESGADPIELLRRKELVILGQPEIRWMRDQTREMVAKAVEAAERDKAELDLDALFAEAEAFMKDNKANMRAMKNAAGLDVALFGRMVAGDIEARVDAAVHVAHAFTVSKPQVNSDFFTAVDDLMTGTDSGGAGHMNTTELTSGYFYHYTVIDVPLLVSNIDGCAPGDWERAAPESLDMARKVIESLIHMAATVSPGAKKGSTAPYASADLVYVQVGDRLPMTLANAFRRPVADELDAVQDAMTNYITRKDAQMGIDAGDYSRWIASISDRPAPPHAKAASVPALAAGVAAAAIPTREVCDA
ncbi:MAG: type I-E CRISPR-associated protein Cas7/Cse4/CasC [Alphaproteobacteria bacterium]|nr:type I-E CRISPR-associated protein Cas7/Cse4/CasC [Alphaproteobacteria bacterium]